MSRAALAVLSIVALIAACAQTPKAAGPATEPPAVPTEPADAPKVTHATYTCDNGVELAVSFEESGNARVKAGDMAEIELPATPAASGNRFTNGRYELWTKGMDEALWTVGRMAPAHCTAP